MNSSRYANANHPLLVALRELIEHLKATKGDRILLHKVWNAHADLTPLPKARGYASRAGKRQRAELLANMRRR